MEKVKLYFAPMEGITSYTYRNAHNEFFGGCDKYFAPFISPSENERISERHFRDILPENNKDITLVPQTLTNKSEHVLTFESQVKKIGYNGFNINLGCPSGTVVKKGKGAGFLRDPEGVDNFLKEIYENKTTDISVKTRIGYSSGEEMERLTQIYNKYEMESLIIHPRVREAMYKGEPDMETFDKAYKNSENAVCYNGNIFTEEDFKKVTKTYKDIESVMIGRGAIANPAIFREIKGGRCLEKKELGEFTHLLADRYMQVLKSEVFTLRKLKEIWMYMLWNFPDEKKFSKMVRKANNLDDFKEIIKLNCR